MYFAIDLFCVCEIANLFLKVFYAKNRSFISWNLISSIFLFFRMKQRRRKVRKQKKVRAQICMPYILFLHISSNWILCNIRLTFLDDFQIYIVSNTWKIDVSFHVSLKENNKRDFIDGLEIQSWVFCSSFYCRKLFIFSNIYLRFLEGSSRKK